MVSVNTIGEILNSVINKELNLFVIEVRSNLSEELPHFCRIAADPLFTLFFTLKESNCFVFGIELWPCKKGEVIITNVCKKIKRIFRISIVITQRVKTFEHFKVFAYIIITILFKCGNIIPSTTNITLKFFIGFTLRKTGFIKSRHAVAPLIRVALHTI